jgi:hypothetical protein
MTMMIAAAALLAAAGQPQAPEAQPQGGEAQWVTLLELPNGAMTWYDPGSVTRREGTVRVRMRAAPARSSTTGARLFNSVEEVDCSRRTSTTVSLVVDMKDGETMDITPDGAPDAINPNTPLAALHAIVCAPSSGT